LVGGVCFGCNVLGDIAAGDDWFLSISLSLFNTLEIAICALWARRLLGPKPNLFELRHLWTFAGISAVASLSAALLAAGVHTVIGRRGIPQTLAVWTFADFLGLVIVTPALLGISRDALAQAISPPTRWRTFGVLAGLVAVDCAAFAQDRYPLWSLVTAALLVAVFELEALGASVGLLVTGVIALGFTAAGHGPATLLSNSPIRQVFALQLFLLINAVVNLAVATTLAQRRRLKDAVMESEVRYRQLAEYATDMIVRYDTNGVIEFASPSVRQLGYEPEQLVGHRFRDFMHQDELLANRQVLSDLKDGGPALSHERRMRRPDGEWVWLQGTPSPIRGSDDTVIGAVTVLRDVTARRQMEEELRRRQAEAESAAATVAESEARYRMVLDRITDVIIRYNSDGVIEFVSPSVRQLGYEPGELVGRHLADFSHPDEREASRQSRKRLFAGESDGARAQIRIRRADGKWVWVETNPAPIRDEAGVVIGVVTAQRDMTEHRAMEDELRRKRAEAEAATVAKSEFLANMSHEIRTPLTGMLGFAGLLEHLEGLPPTARKYVDRIATSGQALLAVVNDILDFSKLDADRIELDPHPFDPAALAAETLELVAAEAARKGLLVHKEFQEDLPAAVFADGSRVRQVLLNLLTNAIKFTDEGSVTVTARYLAESGRLRFSVTDTGVGIPEDRLDRLFQRFSQVDGSITRQYGGTGLGLAICKRLTEMMGGQIEVESRQGEGSTFGFTIDAPLAELEEAPAAPVQQPDEVSASARILVVDDVAVNRELVRTMLSPFGCELVEAASGAEAVAEAMAGAFDLILMDLQMPGMDGLSATQAIRQTCEANRGTPILALSANVLPVHLAECAQAGMDDHIAKPISPRELLTKIARWTAPSDISDGAETATA
jgi:PAS domain S-box-containing protein